MICGLCVSCVSRLRCLVLVIVCILLIWWGLVRLLIICEVLMLG